MVDELMKENFPNDPIKEDNYFIDFMREAPEVQAKTNYGDWKNSNLIYVH